MAETKAKQSSKSTRAKPKAAAKPKASKSRPKAKARSKSQKSRKAPAKASKNGGSNGIGDGAKAVRDAVGSAGKDAGQATAHAASKAKLPLLAGSAALLGAAGGLALGASRSGSKVLGIRMPASKRVKIRSSDLARAAKDVGHFGDRVGELTTEIRRVRQGVADGAADSPIEVLLRGLTKSRR
jgi:hypothetical protein